MNTSPFSLDTKFLPADAREDKIDLDLGRWEITGVGSDDSTFKNYLGGPPDGCEDMAWKEAGPQFLFGWFFLRPTILGKDRKTLRIRSQSLKNPKNDLRHEAPLCGGYCLLYQDKKPQPVTGDISHRAKLTLYLNMPRFIRHQPKDDNPMLTESQKLPLRLMRRSDKRSFYKDEFSFDGQDNWIPDFPEWKNAAQPDFENYLNLIRKQFSRDLKRAARITQGLSMDHDDWNVVSVSYEEEYYSLRKVETFWEFPSDNPIGDVFDIGQKLIHLKNQSGDAVHYPATGRNHNSPCFTIPLAEGVELKLYAKTNRRIRFEVVHTGIMRRRATLLKDAGIPFDKDSQPLDELYQFIPLLRRKAAKHMEQVMTELRDGRIDTAKASSVVNLLSEITSAVSSTLPEQARFSQIQTMLLLLCYQRGIRGSIAKGPYAEALKTLKSRKVIIYDRNRQFSALAPAYTLAADALIATASDPLLPIFSSDGSIFEKSGKGLTRIRKELL